MTEGTATRSAEQIHAAAELLGASLSASAGWDGDQLGLTVRTADTATAVALIADIARNATLPAAEIGRQRAIAADAVRVSMRDPGDVANLTAARALYGNSDYGHPAGGTELSLSAITRADIQAAYRATWRPGNTTLILSGDIDPAEALRIAERHFGDWARRRGAGAPHIRAAPGAASGRDRGRHARRRPGRGRGGARRHRPPRPAHLPSPRRQCGAWRRL